MLSCGLHVRGCACYVCSNTNCSHVKLVLFTCKSRFCSSCGKKATAAWIQRQIEILPKTEWQHINFTMPKTISRLFKLNRELLNQLSRLSAESIKAIAAFKQLIPGIFTSLIPSAKISNGTHISIYRKCSDHTLL